MNALPDFLIIIACIFAAGAVIALFLSGFYGTAYQSKLSELEKHMRTTSGEPSDDRVHSSSHL